VKAAVAAALSAVCGVSQHAVVSWLVHTAGRAPWVCTVMTI